MKKFTFLLIIMMSFLISANGQMVEDFEHIKMNLMLDGEEDNSTMRVIRDPTIEETEPFNYVVEYLRSMNGVPWGGFWSALPEPLDLTENKYVHVRVLKSRISPLKFKVEDGPDENLEIFSMEEQTLVDEWEDIVFDFSEKTGNWNVIAFMPDFEDPLTLEEDIVIHFDQIMVNNDPTPGSDPVYIVEDYEVLPMNLMKGGEEDTSELSIVQNPDVSTVNESEHVVRFDRSMNGVPWGGFWANLDEPIDLTENKYIYVKVWKSRISPLRFKIENGNSDPLEIESMNEQTLTNQWEEIVFDFSEKTGTWETIAFMPDFEDPLTLEEDIVIYFDEIRVGSAPGTDVYEPLTSDLEPVVYPNPAKSLVSVSHNSPIISIKVIDMTGRTVLIKDNLDKKHAVINIAGLKKGNYIIRISGENFLSNQKLSIIK